jgi:hypothetical protein
VYETLAAQITTLGGLLQSNEAENRKKILEESVVKDLIAIMSHEKTDPIFLTAVCTFALDLFETPEVANDAEFMEPFY